MMKDAKKHIDEVAHQTRMPRFDKIPIEGSVCIDEAGSRTKKEMGSPVKKCIIIISKKIQIVGM